MSEALNLDDESAWDDSVILQIYHETVKSHQTKGGNYKKRKLSEALARLDSSAIGEPGQWQSCEPGESSDTRNQRPHVVGDATEAEATLLTSTIHGAGGNAKIDEALNKMLHAWYESGYATGRYYALREAYEGIPTPPGVDKAIP